MKARASFFGLLLGILSADVRAADIPPLLPLNLDRARVVVVHDAHSVVGFKPQPEPVEQMVARGLIELTGQRTLAAAWQSLVSSQDTVGIKVHSASGEMIGTRPAVVEAVVKNLLEAGFAAKQIVIWDKQLSDLYRAGYQELTDRFGVRLAGSANAGYDDQVFYEKPLLGRLVWGDHEFGKHTDGVGRKSFVSKLLTEKITKIIHITPALNHNLAGVSGNLYGLAFGSVDNHLRFESSPTQLAAAIPELYAIPEIGDRVVLNIVDALICQYQGEAQMRLHYSTMLGQLRFSLDPVALDVMTIQELNRQRELAKIQTPPVNFQIYTNASLLQLGVSDLRKIDVINIR